MIKPILIIGYGNPSRGDDALGCLLLEFIQQSISSDNIEIITDFQLQIEFALDIQNRQLVLFADAGVNMSSAFTFSELSPCQDLSISSHALSPSAVLQVFKNITGQNPPPSFLLSIQAKSFELGDDLSESALNNYHQACQFIAPLLNNPLVELWRQQISTH